MNREQIRNTLETLAKSQGFYGRLLRNLKEDKENEEKFYKELEAQHFKNDIELIMFIEG